jgi:hypothetical protein
MQLFRNRIKGVPCHHGRDSPQAEDRSYRTQNMGGIGNILNK